MHGSPQTIPSRVVAVFWLARRPLGADPSFIPDAKVSPKLQRSGTVWMHDAKDT